MLLSLRRVPAPIAGAAQCGDPPLGSGQPAPDHMAVALRAYFRYVTVHSLADVTLADGPVPPRRRTHGAASSVAVEEHDSVRHRDLHHKPRPHERDCDPRAFWLASGAAERDEARNRTHEYQHGANEYRHQVASAALSAKSVVAFECYPPPRQPTKSVAERNRAALVQQAKAEAPAAAAELAYANAYANAMRPKERSPGRPTPAMRHQDLGYSVRGPGFRPGSAAARHAAGSRPPLWPGEVTQPLAYRY